MVVILMEECRVECVKSKGREESGRAGNSAEKVQGVGGNPGIMF